MRAEVRARRSAGRRALAVLDDDPTGSQAVHGVQVVTVFDPTEYRAALEDDDAVGFILTNTRGIPEPDAVRLNERIASELFALGDQLGREIDLVSRGDSTLRGHVLAEVRALDAAHRRATGRGYDAVLFAPAFFDAGRTTVDDIHLVRVGDRDVPAGETEYARDATFGYRASNLREFVAEKSGGDIPAETVRSISLEDIRSGGPEHIAAMLGGLRGGVFVVVNAEHDDDYDTVALGVAIARDAGAALLTRAGPSFVRALAGIEPSEPLDAGQVWAGARRPGHGLVVVGSHVSGTTRQVERLRARRSIRSFELDVARVLADPASRAAAVAELGDAIVAELDEGDVLLATSRSLVSSDDPARSLEIARTVSSSLTAVAARALDASPAWVVAKGGITSHEVAATAFGVRRALVAGQLGRGIISLFRPLTARPEAIGMPYVVFAGNVGDDDALADVVDTLG